MAAQRMLPIGRTTPHISMSSAGNVDHPGRHVNGFPFYGMTLHSLCRRCLHPAVGSPGRPLAATGGGTISPAQPAQPTQFWRRHILEDRPWFWSGPAASVHDLDAGGGEQPGSVHIGTNLHGHLDRGRGAPGGASTIRPLIPQENRGNLDDPFGMVRHKNNAVPAYAFPVPPLPPSPLEWDHIPAQGIVPHLSQAFTDEGLLILGKPTELSCGVS